MKEDKDEDEEEKKKQARVFNTTAAAAAAAAGRCLSGRVGTNIFPSRARVWVCVGACGCVGGCVCRKCLPVIVVVAMGEEEVVVVVATNTPSVQYAWVGGWWGSGRSVPY